MRTFQHHTDLGDKDNGQPDYQKQYAQASVFIAALDLQILVMEMSALTPDQREAAYAALDALIEAVR